MEKGDFFKKEGEIEHPVSKKSKGGKKLKFSGSNLDIDVKNNKLEIKKTPIGHIGVNRFDTESDKTRTIPSQVIEEWIDETLKIDEEERLAN